MPGRGISGGGGIWTILGATGALAKINPASNRVVAVLPIQAFHVTMAASGDAVWVSADGEPLVRVDTQTDSITRWVGNGGNAVSAGSGAVWLANNTFNELLRIPFKALGAAR